MRFKKVLVMSLVLVLCVAYSGTTWAASKDLSKLVLSTNQVTLEIGETAEVTATGVYTDNSTENVTIKAKWTSQNELVATMYNGTITANGEGTSTITAIYDGQPASVQVTVTKKVKALTKDVQELELRTGQTAEIKLTATYSDNTTEDVSTKADWSTDNGNVITVVNGSVKAYNSGSATITATYGKQTVTIPVSVEVVKRITASKSYLSMLLNDSQKITLTATYPDGSTKEVEDVAEWSSSNEDVADVIKGEITAYAAGSAVITAKYGTKTATIQVDVDKTRKLEMNKQDVFLHVNDQEQLTLTAVYPDKGPSDVTKDAVWTSSDEKIAYVNNGLVFAQSPGGATITAKYGDKAVTVNVDVDIPRHLDMEEELSMSINDTHELKLTATYANGKTDEVQDKATWKSSQPDVVFVTTDGKLTAYKKGNAKISATYGGVTVTADVAVDMPLKIALPAKSVSIKVDGTYQASLILSYGSNKPSENLTDKVEWSSSKTDVAEVDENGLVTGIATGTTTLTAKYDGKSYTMKIEVGLAKNLEADVRTIILSSGEKKQITLSAVSTSGEDLDDVTDNAVWKSSNASVADVSKGLVTAFKNGKTNITAEYGGQKVTIPVEVDMIQSIEVSESSLYLKSHGKLEEKTQTLKLEVTLSDGTTRDVTDKAEWKTSNYKIVSVKDGKVFAVGYGKTSVSAKYAGKTVRIPVEVDVLKYLQTNEVSLNMKKGETFKLTATATYNNGTEGDVSTPAVWSSSRILTATVKDGVVKATGKGKATITVKYGNKSTKVIVTVQ